MSSTGKNSDSGTTNETSKTPEINLDLDDTIDSQYITSGSTNRPVIREYTLDKPERYFENIEESTGESLEICMEGYDIQSPELTIAWTDNAAHKDMKGRITFEVERTYIPENSFLSELYKHVSDSYSGLDNLLSVTERQSETVENQTWKSWKNIIEVLEDK